MKLTVAKLIKCVGGAHGHERVVDQAGQRVDGRARASGEKSLQVTAPHGP